MKRDQNNDPLWSECSKVPDFGNLYGTPEVQTLFREFFKNSQGSLDAFTRFWYHIAAKLGDNKYVIGFDPLNEPIGSAKDPFNFVKMLLVEGVLDRENLEPMYAKIFNALYAANNHSIIYFEPYVFPDILPFKVAGLQVSKLVRPVGFTTPPGGQFGSVNHALNGHTYCCQLNHDVCEASGEPVKGSDAECNEWHENRLGVRNDDAKRLGIPFVVTEFGACMNTEDCTRELTQVTDICERE